MREGQRVTCQGRGTGEIVSLVGGQALVYFGTYDGKRVEKVVPETEITLLTEQELEDLL